MDIFKQQKYLKRTILILVLINIVLISFFVWREIKPHHTPLLFPQNEAYHDVSTILKRELNLNQNQVSKLNEIRERYYLKEIDLKKKIKDLKDSMNDEMFKNDSHDIKIITLAEEISINEYKMEMLRYNQAKELKSICTPQQQLRFEALVKEIRDYFRPDNQPTKR